MWCSCLCFRQVWRCKTSYRLLCLVELVESGSRAGWIEQFRPDRIATVAVCLATDREKQEDRSYWTVQKSEQKHWCSALACRDSPRTQGKECTASSDKEDLCSSSIWSRLLQTTRLWCLGGLDHGNWINCSWYNSEDYEFVDNIWYLHVSWQSVNQPVEGCWSHSLFPTVLAVDVSKVSIAHNLILYLLGSMVELWKQLCGSLSMKKNWAHNKCTASLLSHVISTSVSENAARHLSNSKDSRKLHRMNASNMKTWLSSYSHEDHPLICLNPNTLVQKGIVMHKLTTSKRSNAF